MQLTTPLITILALITPIHGFNKRCNHYTATANTKSNIQCAKSSVRNECNNICRGWADRLKAISLRHSSPAPGNPWGSHFIAADPSTSGCNGPTGLDPTDTACTCTVRLRRGRTYIMDKIKPESGDPSRDYPNLNWDDKFAMYDGQKIRCGGE